MEESLCDLLKMSGEKDTVIELNVGGVHYTTTRKTLTCDKNSRLGEWFDASNSSSSLSSLVKDVKGRYFLDRDGVLFRFVLDYLRDNAIHLPDGFREKQRLLKEAEYLKLHGLMKCIQGLNDNHSTVGGCITVGYRGSFQFGKDGLADVKFRKLSRILVCGRVALCREVFSDTLNESRDPDHGGPDRYSSRLFLKHSFLEQAFDMLSEKGFRLAGSCGSGTAGSASELKPGVDVEENRWNHYNEFVFIRD